MAKTTKAGTKRKRAKSSPSSASGATQAVSQLRTYLASLSPEARRCVRKLGESIRAAAPGAVADFGYGIPGFRLDGQVLLWYAAWKHHCSLYPISPGILRTLGPGVAGYETSKSTIRFPLAKPPSSALVRRLVKARIVELRGKRTE